jgi:hypothetical protein
MIITTKTTTKNNKKKKKKQEEDERTTFSLGVSLVRSVSQGSGLISEGEMD